MSNTTAEIVRLCEALPEDKRLKVIDFARFLLRRIEHPGNPAWDDRLANPAGRPNLEAFPQESAAESSDEPLNLVRFPGCTG
jgi:hypothetical protein